MKHQAASVRVYPLKQDHRRAHRAKTQSEAETAHPVDMHVGQQIRIRRIQASISQGELGLGIGVSFQQIQKYESGRNRISASMLYRVANFLNVPVATFFDGLPDTRLANDGVIATEIDDRITYISTAEGRRLIEDVLPLSPRVRSRVISLVCSLVDEDEASASNTDPATDR